MADSDDDSEAMIRWQAYARESRTTANQHFLTYSAAILAIQTSIVVGADAGPITLPSLFVWAGVLAVVALALGSLIVLIRLRDARLTARVARYKHTNRKKEDIESMRKKADFYGGWTNKLLPWQVISFTLSAALLIAWVVSAHHGKLFPAAG